MIDYEMCYWSIKKWLIGQLAKVLLGGEKKKSVNCRFRKRKWWLMCEIGKMVNSRLGQV